SLHGAVRESEHVFIRSGLESISKETITVFECGFGTGLNAWLTAIYAKKMNILINYFSIELYPLNIEFVNSMCFINTANIEEINLLQTIHTCQWDTACKVSDNFIIHKIQDDITQFDFKIIDTPIDLVYFDAFSPEKQPEMWDPNVFKKLWQAMNKGAVLVTYCAKGIIRRRLQEIGFTVERLQGPPGKKEMLRAIK
ncbi:MAG: tRNA (5-methylaminomethyl-2-thiouridine)(34)-methyltransferase MnmD, partial [Bacteroidales bacterium]